MTLALLLHESLVRVARLVPVLAPLAAIVTLFLTPEAVFLLFLGSLGAQGLFIDLGTTITLPRVFIVLCLLSFLLHRPAALRRAWSLYPAREVLILVLLFLAASIVLNLPFLPEKTITTSAAPIQDTLLRGRIGRGVTQWLTFALRAATPLVFLAIVTTPALARWILKRWLTVTTLVCFYGLYQVPAFYFHLPAVFIYRGFGDPTGRLAGIVRIAQGSTGALNIFRVSSLLGEPKQLAAFLLPTMVFLGVLALRLSATRTTTRTRQRAVWALFAIHVVTFILTFSTGGWVAALVSAVFVLWSSRHSATFWRIVTGISIGFVILGILATAVPTVSELLHARLLDRLGRETVENPVSGIPQLLHMQRTWPHTIFIGASPGGVLLYERFLGSQIGVVSSLTDIGVLGFLLSLFLWWQCYARVTAAYRAAGVAHEPLYSALAAALLSAIVSTIVNQVTETTFTLWVIVGIAAAFAVTASPQRSPYETIAPQR